MANLLALAWNCSPKKALLAPEETQHSSIDLSWTDLMSSPMRGHTKINLDARTIRASRISVKGSATIKSSDTAICSNLECWPSCKISTPNSIITVCDHISGLHQSCSFNCMFPPGWQEFVEGSSINTTSDQHDGPWMDRWLWHGAALGALGQPQLSCYLNAARKS